MSVNVNVQIKNMDEIKAAFRLAPTLMAKELDKAIAKSIFAIQGTSMTNTPVDTGRLRASHMTMFAPLRGVLDVTAYYGVFVHEGTRYMKPRPFLLNAVTTNEASVDDNFAKAVDNVLKQLGDSSK
jgi:HK97 gp10 family phage protein